MKAKKKKENQKGKKRKERGPKVTPKGEERNSSLLPPLSSFHTSVLLLREREREREVGGRRGGETE